MACNGRKRKSASHETSAGDVASSDLAAASAPLLGLAGLSDDTLSAALVFLDVPSLVRAELTGGRCVKKAAGGAWSSMEESLAKKSGEIRADGDTARERVIRSCSAYRCYLLAEYAERVEKMEPTVSEQLYRNLKVKGEDTRKYDFYIRFSRKMRASAPSTFLAGGLFSLTEVDSRGGLDFDLTGCDLGNWPSMQRFLSPKGEPFLSWCLKNDGEMYRTRVKSLEGVNATVVAINRKTMSKSIVMVNESNDFLDEPDPRGAVECMWHTQGVMSPFQWEGREYDQGIDDDDMVFTDFIFLDDGWSLHIRY